MAEKKKYTAADLVGMIRSKYSGPAYTVLEQVAEGTGAGTASWVDAAVFSLWPSNGIWRSACEVKVSRQDWLHELSDHTKNEWARQHFDYFWYVTAPGVAKDDETPGGCGLMVVRGGGLSILKHAPRREGIITDPSIVASFARSLEKEKTRFIEKELKQAVESHREFNNAKLYKTAVDKYLRMCGTYCYPDDADELVNKLKEIASTAEQKAETKEADHMLALLGKLQTDAIDFLLAVAPLCTNLLNARDETGEFICELYSRSDKESLIALKDVLKGRNPKYVKDAARSRIAVKKALQESA